MDADRIALADLAKGSVRNIPRGPADYALGEGGALLQKILDTISSMTQVDVRKPAPWGTVDGKFQALPSVMDRIGSVSSENLLGRPGDVMEKGSYGFPISPVEMLDLANVVVPGTAGARGLGRAAAREVGGKGAGMTLAGSRAAQGGLIGKKTPSPADINAAINGGEEGVFKPTAAVVRFGGQEFDAPIHALALKKAIDAGVLKKGADGNWIVNREGGDAFDLFRGADGTTRTRLEISPKDGPEIKAETLNLGAETPAPGSPAEINAKIRNPRAIGSGEVTDTTQQITSPTMSAIPRRSANMEREVAYPGVYDDPKRLAAEAASRVAPESPLLQELFGVSRDDLYEISKQGTREGNMTGVPFKLPPGSRGARHAQDVMNPENESRLINLIDATREHPDLFKGMASWYTMDPLYQRMVKLYGEEAAPEAYRMFNTLTGMASPGSEVLTELNRGTAAHMMAKKGRFDEFRDFAGIAEGDRGANFPEELRNVISHPYHPTAQAGPMEKYVNSGEIDMGSAKVPSYIHASGVPETGFQTRWPVGDAHWSRIVGLPDYRGVKGAEGLPNVASASVPEMAALGPWWREQVAAKAGLESVPAQAVVWGGGSGATGVTSPIGAGKLELLAMSIGKAAQRMGVSPTTARDMILTGKAHAGFADPELLAVIAAAGGAAALASPDFTALLKGSE